MARKTKNQEKSYINLPMNKKKNMKRFGKN